MTGPWYAQAGALTVTGEGSLGNRNIQIWNNTFQDINAANLVVRWAQNVTVKGNRFLNAHRTPNRVGDVGKDVGVDATALIWLGDCRGIALSGNWAHGTGHYTKQLVVAAPTATDITGINDGLKTASRESH